MPSCFRKLKNIGTFLKRIFTAWCIYSHQNMHRQTSFQNSVMTRNPELTEETTHEMTKYVEDVSTLTGDQKGFVESMSATQYWNIFGRCRYPLLYGYAKSLNVLACSSASAERAWSIFGFVHRPLRNRLSNEKVEKLVFLYINSAMLDENDKSEYILEEGHIFSEEHFFEWI